MASGIKVTTESTELMQNLKMKKAGQIKYRYLVLKMDDDCKNIIPDLERMSKATDSDGEGPGHFQEVVTSLPSDDARYVLYDYSYTKSFGPANKIIMVMWCPESTKIKHKMVYASSKDSLKKALNMEVDMFQADCVDELKHDLIEAKLNKV